MRLIPRVLLVEALILVWGAAIAAPTGPEIENLVRGGKLDEAIEAGRAAVEATPADPDLRVALAHALAVKARTSRKVVEMAVKADDLLSGNVVLPRLGPDTPMKTEVTYDAKLLGEALRNLQEAEKLAPRRKDVLLKRCFLLTDSGDVAGAVAAIKNVVAALPGDPNLPGDLAALGNERAEGGDPKGGSAILAAVAKAFPSDAAVEADYGYALAQAGKKTEGLAALDRAVALAPADLRIHARRCAAAMLLRDFQKARAAYQASAASGGGDVDGLGRAAAAIGCDLKAAKAELGEMSKNTALPPEISQLAADLVMAATRRPSDPKNVELAKSLADGKKEILAIPILHRALRANAANKQAAALLAGIYRAFGFRTLADETIRAARQASAAPAAKPASKPANPQPSGSSKR
jgi:Flp pilus assembly protein TadD